MKYDVLSPLALGRLSDPQEIESCAVMWLQRLEQARWPRMLQTFENASFLCGNHMTRWYYSAEVGVVSSTFGGEDDKSKFDSTIAKVADNKLIRPYESISSNLSAIQPYTDVSPMADTPEAEDGAEVADRLIGAAWDQVLQMPALLGNVGKMGFLAGWAVSEIEYGETDIPVEQPKIVKEKAPNPWFGTDDQPEEVDIEVERGTEVVFARGVNRRLWSLPHIYVNPGAESLDDARWIARTTLVDIDFVKENFKDGRKADGFFSDKVEGISSAGLGNHPLYWWHRVQEILDTPHSQLAGAGMSGGVSDAHESTQCLFTVIDVKPTRQYPRGRTMILADRRLLYLSPKDVGARAWSAENPWRWHGYAEWGWLKLPGRLEPIAAATEVLPLQKKINSIDVLVHLNRQAMSLGQWLIPTHSRVRAGKPSGIPQDHVIYRDVPGASKPERISNEPMPSDLFEERAQLERSIDIILATGLIDTNAISASAARAGTIFEAIKAERTQSKTDSYLQFQRFVNRTVQNVLIEIQLHAKDGDPLLTDLIQNATQDLSKSAVAAFLKMPIRDGYTVKLDIVSQITKSPEAQKEMAMTALQYNPQATPEEKAAVWKAIGLDKFMKNPTDASVNRARRLISRIRNNQVPQGVAPQELYLAGVDDVAAMVPVFQREMSSDRFFDSYTKEARAFLTDLLTVYSTVLQQMIQAQMQQQMMMASAGVKPQGGGNAG